MFTARSHVFRLPLVAALLGALILGLLTTSLSPPTAHAQTNHDVYLAIVVGQGSNSYVTGYVQNYYGEIDPDGFNVGPISGSISRITWNDQNTNSDGRKEMRVVLTVVAAYPLESVRVEHGDTYDCQGSGRSYICTDSDSSPDQTPWKVNQEHNILLRFPEDAVVVNQPSGGGQFPSATRVSGGLPPAFGARDSSKDIELDPANDNTFGVYVAGGLMYVMDNVDKRVYVYSTRDGDRDQAFEWILGTRYTWYGFAGRGSLFYFVRSGTPARVVLYTQVGTDGSGNAIMSTSVAIELEDTSYRGGAVYSIATRGNGFAIGGRYGSGRVTRNYRFGLRNTSGGSPQDVLLPSGESEAGSYGAVVVVNDAHGIFWINNNEVPDAAGNNSKGLKAYDLNAFERNSVFNHLPAYDLSLGHTFQAAWTDGSTLYVDNKTTTPNDTIQAYHFDPNLVYDDSDVREQYPPTIVGVEFDNARTVGNAHLVDIKTTIAHTSTVLGGATNLEYRYSSAVAGSIEPRIAPPSTEFTVKNIPQANYDLKLDVRYHWYNRQVTGNIVIENSPFSDNCDEDDLDDSEDLNGDGDTRNDDNMDTETPNCAFVLKPGDEKYSTWASTRVSIAGPLTAVPNRSPEQQSQVGLVSTVAGLLLTSGVQPADVSALAKNLTIMGWFIVAAVVWAVVYLATGMKTGSMYAASLLWLIIWAGLGPFVAMVPWGMAYGPAALLIFVGGLLMLKRGKV